MRLLLKGQRSSSIFTLNTRHIGWDPCVNSQTCSIPFESIDSLIEQRSRTRYQSTSWCHSSYTSLPINLFILRMYILWLYFPQTLASPWMKGVPLLFCFLFRLTRIACFVSFASSFVFSVLCILTVIVKRDLRHLVFCLICFDPIRFLSFSSNASSLLLLSFSFSFSFSLSFSSAAFSVALLLCFLLRSCGFPLLFLLLGTFSWGAAAAAKMKIENEIKL